MASQSEIMNAIRTRVGQSGYSSWQIGITEDHIKRKSEWGQTKNVSYWTCWKADSSADAKDIEAYFLEKGMKGGTGGTISRYTIYVYIF